MELDSNDGWKGKDRNLRTQLENQVCAGCKHEERYYAIGLSGLSISLWTSVGLPPKLNVR
jgi:hypothetical protein